MNGGLDPEIESPAEKIETEIRWINHNLEGKNYNPEYKEILRQKKLILALQLININKELSFEDRLAIKALVFPTASQTGNKIIFIFGLCIGISISIVICYFLFY